MVDSFKIELFQSPGLQFGLGRILAKDGRNYKSGGLQLLDKGKR